MAMKIRGSVVMSAAALLALAGCAPAADRAAAADSAALQLFTRLHAQDGAAACAMLAPDTAAEVAESGGKPCAQAILDEDLADPGVVATTAVYGQRAQVRLTGDTVFLAVFPGGWRVVAAGCRPDGADRPYDCSVQSG
jgi:hypothetical protein